MGGGIIAQSPQGAEGAAIRFDGEAVSIFRAAFRHR
jgi:hypothetical protein